MSLAEMAKQLQGEAISPEVKELRRMRKFIAVHDYNEMNGRWAEVARMEVSGEKGTLEGRYWILKCIKELNRDEGLIKLYRATLQVAEKLERSKRGAGAVFFRENQERLYRVETAICKEAKDWQNMQVSIDELIRIEEGYAVGETSDGGFIADVRGDGAYCP
ncbi:hypothetical protein [Anaerotignum propionicum]|uniref:hypothetical protein n=1 Tax=Anaerotignum propionicum TaxID=28446 RepID=UPI0028A1FD77|nr:hypothetical protein [Anaerotignum propionicum]